MKCRLQQLQDAVQCNKDHLRSLSIRNSPLLSADGTIIIKDKEGISARWEEHFSQLLNRPSTVDQAALEQIPQKPTHEDLDLPPTEDEVRAAIKQMNCGKAPGKDGLPAEIFKALGDTAFQAFHDVLCTIWEDEDMPADLRDATIVALYKNKGAKADCGNYRGISLLSIAGKILARILLNRLIENISEDNLPEAQCVFRPGRSTIDMVFTVRQIQEKCSEQQMDLYAVFIDLTKTFDTVNREALWSVLLKLGCPRKFTTLIRLFHDNMTGQVLLNGEHSNTFAISNGVKQGCVLATVLFNLFFTQVLLHAVKDLNLGVYIKYRLDGSLFDLRRLSARRKTLEKLILEALFADDCALMAHKENHLQVIVDRFADAARLFGLTISLGKTEVLVQPAPNTTRPQPVITIDELDHFQDPESQPSTRQTESESPAAERNHALNKAEDLQSRSPPLTPIQLKCVDSFKYLGSTISADGTLDKENFSVQPVGAYVLRHCDQDGGPSPTRQPLPLMKIGDSVSLQQGTNVTGQRPPRSKMRRHR